MLRSIYYWMPPSIRLLARRLVFLPYDLLTAGERKGKLLPPKGIIFTGSGDFLKDGQRWTQTFKSYGLSADDAFLDIGSGIGRIAVGLTDYLSEKSRYEGFDIMETGVNWCQDHITAKHPPFNFKLIDLKNDLYRNTGADASNWKFPYEDNAFDMACATSLFTHMLPDETENYLAETARCLKEDGKLIATFFLHDPKQGDSSGEITFRHLKEGYALHSERSKAANVRYDLGFLNEMASRSGLEIKEINHGFWRGGAKDEAKDFQDLVVFSPRNA